jgi:hypothetical protein
MALNLALLFFKCYKSMVLKMLLQQFEIPEPANAVCECMHQTVGNILHTLFHARPPTNIHQAQDIMDTALATASHATCAAIH